MADADTKEKPLTEAEQKAANKAKQAKIEKLEEGQREEDERNHPPATPVSTAKAEAPALVTAPTTEAAFRMVEPRDVWVVGESADSYVTLEVRCRGIDAAHALKPEYLWPVRRKIKLFMEVVLRDEAWRWEVRARVMRINDDLRLIITHPITQVVIHDILPSAKIDFDQLEVVNKGAVDKWTVMLRNQKVKVGFITKEEADNWIAIAKIAA